MKVRPNYFYSDLVTFDDLYVDLSNLVVSEKEKQELMDIAHIHLHGIIIDTILSHLPESDKKKFLENLATNDGEKIWNHLNEKVEKIEEKIIEASKAAKDDLKKDIKNIKV